MRSVTRSVKPRAAFKSKKDVVYETLRASILEGERQPGTRLIIDDLAAEFGVSPIPVREALQQLKADGYVEIQPYVGARVAEVRLDSIVEIFDLLEALEVISGRAACQNFTDADFVEMEALLHDMDDEGCDIDSFAEKNVRLHRFICDRAGTRLTGPLIGKVLDHWDRLRRLYLKDVFLRRREASQREHWRMFQALRSRDPDQVETVVRAHNRAARAAYVAYVTRLRERTEERVS